MVKKPVTYKGREFASIRDAWYALFRNGTTNLVYASIVYRMKKYDLSFEEAVHMRDEPSKKKPNQAIPCTYDGVEYESLGAMAKALGINKDTIYQRYYRGKRGDELVKGFVYTDHLGNTYNTKVKMCEAYGVNYNTYNVRIARGYTVKEALTGEYDTRFTVYDHLGNRFNNESEMCGFHHVSINTYRARKRHGNTVGEALTGKINDKRRINTCFDHLGNKYINETEMCKAYGIKHSTYSCRRNKGMTVKDALTLPLFGMYKSE